MAASYLRLSPSEDLSIHFPRRGEGARNVVLPRQAFLIGERPEKSQQSTAGQARRYEAHQALLAVQRKTVEGRQAKLRPMHARRLRAGQAEDQAIRKTDQKQHPAEYAEVALGQI